MKRCLIQTKCEKCDVATYKFGCFNHYHMQANNRLEEEMYVSRHLTVTYVMMVAASNFPLTTHYILHSTVSLWFTFVSHTSANNFVTLCYI